jgi:hypothetical protein
LICRFCEQWNLDSAPRCVFCGNAFSSETDDTLAGRPSYDGPRLTVPVPMNEDQGGSASKSALPVLEIGELKLRLTPRQAAILLGVLLFVAYVLSKLRC